MDRDSINRLRFDRRLELRRGWADEGERAQNLEALPDVTDKMTRGLDEPEDEAGAADAEPPVAGFAAPEPTPSGSFGGVGQGGVGQGGVGEGGIGGGSEIS